ncbi:NAD-dependent epimerase/dehydratase family protein [candidate division KSB1 bacterium]|nr:NAD-dependent epimerase/dehydratase family protein [candidate division KSB1 bacterium]
MKILFIGGTGVISSACSKLCIEKGHDLYLLNRGHSFRTPPREARIWKGDIRDVRAMHALLKDQEWDVVVDWIAFTPDHVQADIELFRGKTKQYIFISSASAYQTPPQRLPLTESTPLSNPYWQYSRDKIACEKELLKVLDTSDFPATLVRPSHTYDATKIPLKGGYLFFDRLKKGKQIIIHGDGTSLWTLTHHRDFAKGFLGLLGQPQAIGEAFHITSDEWLTWNQIATLLAHAAGYEPDIIHIPSDFIAQYDPEWGAGLLGDKAHSMIFDNSKIKHRVPDFEALISFQEGAKEIVEWYDSHPDQQSIDKDLDSRMERMISKYIM